MLARRLCALGLCLLLLGTASAQKDKPPKKGYLPPNFKKLGLSTDQETKVRKVTADFKAKRDALRKQMDQLKIDERTALDKILTDAQRKKLRKLLLGSDEEKDKGTKKDSAKKDSKKKDKDK